MRETKIKALDLAKSNLTKIKPSEFELNLEKTELKSKVLNFKSINELI